MRWDGKNTGPWVEHLQEADAVVNATGYGLNHWPWTAGMQQRFVDSRVIPGQTLVKAILAAKARPRVFIQFSGVNHYGISGTSVADESTMPGDDFLARLTIAWEGVSEPLASAGVRTVITRNAVVLAPVGGLFGLLALPTRLHFGGRLGSGAQALPWIHILDFVQSVRFLLEQTRAAGAFNVVAPQMTTNAAFMQTLAQVLDRPFWFQVPGGLIRLVLGRMAMTVLDGRPCTPKRLLNLGFKFTFPELGEALRDLTSSQLAANVP